MWVAIRSSAASRALPSEGVYASQGGNSDRARPMPRSDGIHQGRHVALAYPLIRRAIPY